MSLEMLGGERIPPPLPPRSALAEQERERERKQIAPWAVRKQKEDGEILPGSGRAQGAGKRTEQWVAPRLLGWREQAAAAPESRRGTGRSLLRPAPSALFPGWKFSEFLPQDSSGKSMCVCLGRGRRGWRGGSAHL